MKQKVPQGNPCGTFKLFYPLESVTQCQGQLRTILVYSCR